MNDLVPHKLSRRAFTGLAFGTAMGGIKTTSAAEDSPWEIVKHNSLEYVTANSVNEFYRFERFYREGKDIFYRSTHTLMRWKVDSNFIVINNIKFSLSFPIIERNKKVLISRVDLQKLMDPVLRPWFIKNTQQFHTVTIDAGHGGT